VAAPGSRRGASLVFGGLGLAGLAALAVLIALHGWADHQAADAPRTVAAARADVAGDPLDPAALSALGGALDRTGDPARAGRLMALAGRLSWRDGRAQMWLLHHDLAAGDYPGAAVAADALLRTQDDPAVYEPVFAALVDAARQDAALAPIAARLAPAPQWRTSFLIRLSRAPWGIAGGERLLTALRPTPVPPTDAELAPYVQRLTAEARYAQALADWRRLSRAAPARPAAIQDGEFESGVWDTMPFTWWPGDGAGGYAAVDAGPGQGADRAMRVRYDGVSAPTLPRQLLVLAPGVWRIRWRSADEAGDAARLAWRVVCIEGGAPLATTAGAASNSPVWRDAALSFTVPAAGCAAQWLQLAPDPGERRADIVVWYDKFAAEGPL
jgi:hypothetical protein